MSPEVPDVLELLIGFFFLLLRAAHMAYGSSQARGQIEAIAAGHATDTATATAVLDLSHVCDLHHSSWQMLDSPTH